MMPWNKKRTKLIIYIVFFIIKKTIPNYKSKVNRFRGRSKLKVSALTEPRNVVE